jgi:hypothetical protein
MWGATPQKKIKWRSHPSLAVDSFACELLEIGQCRTTDVLVFRAALGN